MAKIPVAYSRDDLNRLLDVTDVPSGKACNCVCPSCKAPLIARHCTGERESHFAHDPAFENEYNYSECALSYYVALKLMLKQILATADEICLPDFFIDEPYCGEKVEVTKARTLKFDKIEIDKMGFDALISVKRYRLAIVITHPERPSISLPEHENIQGIVEINLALLRRSSMASQMSWTEILSRSLSKEPLGKQWLWHINADKIQEKAKLDFMRMQADKSTFIKESLSRRRSEYAQVKAKPLMIDVHRCYQCFKDYSKQSNIEHCPKCRTKLLLTSIDQKNFQR